MEDQRASVGRVRGTRIIGSGARGEDPLAAASEADDRDVAPIHHCRLGRKVDAHRELATVRCDVEVRAARLPGRQRETGSRERIPTAAGCDVADEDVRLTAVGQPVVPVTKFGALGDMRLDLRVLPLLLALRLFRVGRKIRPNRRHERDALAVGEPFQCGAAVGDFREPLRFAAVGCDQIDLRLVIVLALRGEGNPPAIG